MRPRRSGRFAVSVEAIGCDLLSIAAHKLYGPKGVGALYIRKGTPVLPLLPGAGQERGMRGGTENVPGIVGLGAACVIAARHMAEGGSARLESLRDRLWSGLESGRTGDPADLPIVCGLSRTPFMSDFPASRAMPCSPEFPRSRLRPAPRATPGSDRPPAAILAIGASEEDALGSVRLSLGRGTDRGVDRPFGGSPDPSLAGDDGRESRRPPAIVPMRARRSRLRERTPTSSGGRWPEIGPPSTSWFCAITAT